MFPVPQGTVPSKDAEWRESEVQPANVERRHVALHRDVRADDSKVPVSTSDQRSASRDGCSGRPEDQVHGLPRQLENVLDHGLIAPLLLQPRWCSSQGTLPEFRILLSEMKERRLRGVDQALGMAEMMLIMRSFERGQKRGSGDFLFRSISS